MTNQIAQKLVVDASQESTQAAFMESLTVGHCGSYLSVQEPDAGSRRMQMLAKTPAKRGYTKPTPWPSK